MREEFPEGWTTASLGALLREPLRNGHSAKASPDGLGVRTLTLTAVTYGKFSNENTKLTVADPEKVTDLWLEPGDLLIERSNTPELVGTCRLYRGPKHWAIFPDLVIRARIGYAALPEYVEAHLQSVRSRKYFTESAQGTAGSMPKIDQGSVGSAEIALAPLPEQHRIVEKVEALLEQVNRAKERLDRVPLLLKRFRQAVLAAACSGVLSQEWRESNPHTAQPTENLSPRSNDQPEFTEHLERHEFPDSWRLVRVDAIVRIQNGRAFPSREYLEEGGIRLLRPGNLHASGAVHWTRDNTVVLPNQWAQEFPDFVLGPGELLMNLTAQSLKDEFLGRVCLKEDRVPALLNQRIARLTPVGTQDVRPYLLLYFKSWFFRKFVNGLDTGSLIRHMHSKDVGRHVVPLPPFAEQREIVERVRQLFSLADTIERRLQAATARANKLPQAILSKAFSGELVPTEAELARQEGRTYQPAEELLKRVTGESAGAPAVGRGRGRRKAG